MIEGRGTFHLVEARNPETVCCESALLACALLTVGVPEHPGFAFQIFEEEINGEPVTLWRWVFADRSSDGLYDTGELIKWWKDAEWLASHPVHEWSILRRTLMNMAEVAWRIRSNVPRIVIRRGQNAAFIPANASPARRQHAIDQVEGRIPINAPFVEPSVPASPIEAAAPGTSGGRCLSGEQVPTVHSVHPVHPSATNPVNPVNPVQ